MREGEDRRLGQLDGPPRRGTPSARDSLARAAVGLLLIGGCLVFVPAVLSRGVCAFLPCDPGIANVGFVDAGAGAVGLEIGPVSAQAVETIEVRGVAASDASDGELLWRVQRSGDVPHDWDGSIVVGEVPAGFTETTSLRTPLPAAWTVSAYNECYGGFPQRLPTAPLERHRTTDETGYRESVDTVRTASYGLSSCEPGPGARELAAMRSGVVLAAVGLLLLAVVIGSSFVERRRSSSP